MPPAFSDTSSSGEPSSSWKRSHHRVAAGSRDAAVQERHVELEPLAEVALQDEAHLAELGEHECPFAGGEQVVDELVEAG